MLILLKKERHISTLSSFAIIQGGHRENQGSPSCRRHTPSARAGWCTPVPHFPPRQTSSSHFKFPSNRTCSSTLIELKYSLSYQLNSWLLVRQHFKSFHLLLGCYSCRWCVNRFIVSKFTFLFKYSLSENILASRCLKTGISWTMNKKHVYMKRGASSPHNGLGDVLWLALMKPISKSINNGPTNRGLCFPSPRISLTSPNVDEKKCCVIGIRGASWNPIQDWGQLLYRCWTASSNLQRVIIYTYTQQQLFKRMTINHVFCEAVATWLNQVQSSRYPVL